MEHLLQCLRVSYRRFRDDERIKKVDDDVLCRLLSHRRWLRAGVPFIDAYRRDRSQRVGRVHAYRYARRCITTTGNIALNLALNFKFAVAPVFPLGKFPRWLDDDFDALDTRVVTEHTGSCLVSTVRISLSHQGLPCAVRVSPWKARFRDY